MITFKKFLDTVEESETATRKAARMLVIKLVLLVIPLTLTLVVVASALVNFLLAMCALILGVASFICLLEYASDNESTYKQVRILSQLWFLGIPTLVGIVLFLHIGLGVI